MPFAEYLKPLGAKRFGADHAPSCNQLSVNVQNCSSPLSDVFSPLLYRLSYQATKSANYTQTVVELDKCALLCLLCRNVGESCVGWESAILLMVGHRVEDGLSSVR